MKKHILGILFLVNLQFASLAQTGIKIYTDTDLDFQNTHIIDMQEGKNKEIYLAGESKTDDFNSAVCWFSRIDPTGKQLATKLNGGQISDLKSIVLTENGNAMLLGNTKSTGGKSQTFSSNIDANGIRSSINVMAMSYAMIFGDAFPVNEQTFYATQADLNKETNLFNISIIKSGFLMYSLKPMVQIKSANHEIPTHLEVNSKGEFYVSAIRIQGDETIPILYALHPDGTIKWEFQPSVSTDIENINFTLDAKENCIITTSYRDNTKGKCWTELIHVNTNGELITQKKINDIKANGVLCLKNGTIVLYGAHFQVINNTNIISKANYMLFDGQLNLQLKEELNEKDAPDVHFKEIDQQTSPSSSEFNCAIQLQDGRIAFGGRVLLAADLNYPSENRKNKALVLFTKSDGKYR